MVLTLEGGRAGYKPHVPELKEGEQEPYHLRPATEADLPFTAQVYDHGIRRYPLACVWDEALWRYELTGKSDKNINRRALSVIETPEGEPVGFLAHAPRPWRGQMGAWRYELKPGVSWLAVTPSVVRYLWASGEAWARQEPQQEVKSFVFWLGAEHPAYQVLHDRLPRTFKPYAWYVRVPDLPGFVRHIAPALERRLVDSVVAGHTGELKISLYHSGVRLVLEQGRLVTAEAWQPSDSEDGDAAFPDLTFLQLLFGYRSVEELDHAFADCWTVGDAPRVLLEALFPQQPSDLWPIS
jgi:hypothetical protein